MESFRYCQRITSLQRSDDVAIMSIVVVVVIIIIIIIIIMYSVHLYSALINII